jgi:Plasmid pRiA4b ORF-3-like protein
MTKQLSKGTCALCHGEFSKATMTKHLEACQRRATDARAEAASRNPGRKTKTFHLVVEGRDLPMYWMHLAVSTGATLADLDQFLRATWLECCGHLSAFEIGQQRYLSHAGMDMDWEPDEKSMRVRLDKVLSPGLKCFHEYDFGTTTELSVKVLAEEDREAKGKPIQVLARNVPPVIPCGVCGKSATAVCSQCVYEEGGWLCEACAKAHECGEDMLLPVVNSPRVGMCGYTG